MKYLAADVGGTFTDLVLIDDDPGPGHGVPGNGMENRGRMIVHKVSSRETGSAKGIAEGVRQILDLAKLQPGDIDLFVHGFTIATNAVLTRAGAKAALVVTEGFRDILLIGSQRRPSLYSLTATKPPPVIPRARAVEAAERIDAFGAIVTPLSEAEVERVAAAVAALSPEAVAICLNFSFLNPDHERRIEAAVSRLLPGVPIYLSSRVNPEIEEYPRANTTAIAAHVGPVVARYVDALEAQMNATGCKAPIRLMRSDGGLATPRAARENPAQMLFSGLAGGVIAGADLARGMGIENLVTFDMGGTSADFAVIIGGEPVAIAAHEIDGQPIRLPSLDVATISAGGGSIAWVDVGGALRVGPSSAGAVPGPACYGQGGAEATVTDAAIVLGILDAGEFLGGDMKLDAALAHKAVTDKVAKPLGLSVEDAAFGILSVANANMIQAIRKLSVERGHDIRGFSLLAGGGAGPFAAVYMARELGMAEVLVPPYPGVFAAAGLLLTDLRHTTQAAFQAPLDKLGEADMQTRLAALGAIVDAELAADGIKPADRRIRYGADLRCVGQFHVLSVPLPAPGKAGWWNKAELAAKFHATHARVYGHADEKASIEFVNLRAEGFGAVPRALRGTDATPESGRPKPVSRRRLYADRNAGWVMADIYRRADLRSGHAFSGPAIVLQRDSTVLVLPGQEAAVAPGGAIRIRQRGEEK
jgi:N-methylhydantoinase A